MGGFGGAGHRGLPSYFNFQDEVEDNLTCIVWLFMRLYSNFPCITENKFLKLYYEEKWEKKKTERKKKKTV